MLSNSIINDLQSIEWDKIVSIDLEDCNEGSWRFAKGSTVEYAIAKYKGNTDLTYVNDIHKDFDWPSRNLTVEVKSQLSKGMYTQKGDLRSSFNIKLNNSNGTNKKDILDPNDVADIVIVVKNDGAFCVDKQTILENWIKKGDGFEVILTKDAITEVTGKLNVPKRKVNMREKLINVIKESI